MTPTRAQLVMAWVREGLNPEAIGEYCAIMDRNDAQPAQTRIITGTLADFGRAQIAAAKETLGITEDKP